MKIPQKYTAEFLRLYGCQGNNSLLFLNRRAFWRARDDSETPGIKVFTGQLCKAHRDVTLRPSHLSPKVYLHLATVPVALMLGSGPLHCYLVC